MFTANNLARHSDEEARRLLQQRKKRNRTSCYPCRTRKVKCDRGSPCENCAKRGYPDLCSFVSQVDPGHSRSSIPGHQSSHEQFSPQRHYSLQTRQSEGVDAVQTNPVLAGEGEQRHNIALESVGESRPCNSNSRAAVTGSLQHAVMIVPETNNAEDGQGGAFLGMNSMPAFLRVQPSQPSSANDTASQVEAAILPMLGLRSSRSVYPFLPPLQTSFAMAHAEIHDALPVDREVIRLFQYYRLEVHPFSPIIQDIEKFELDVCAYLENHAISKRHPGHQEQSYQGPESWKSISWVGSLFAVLASGAQYSDSGFQARRQRSQIYVRYSFQCLRMANFLVRPSLSCIQTLLILGHVLQNDMQPEAAWMLLGTTARMAQSLGLHDEIGTSSSPRKQLWLALVWQDSLLSLCFDRRPVTMPTRGDIELSSGASYKDFMHSLCNSALPIVNLRAPLDVNDLAIILELVAKVEENLQKVVVHYGSICTSNIRQRCELFSLKLHFSFVIAWACRPALGNSLDPIQNTETRLQLVEKCKHNLHACIRSFIQLHSLSTLTSRSWAVIHNGLSSALLLGLLNTTTVDPKVQQLLGEILHIFPLEHENKDDGEPNRDGDIELSAPHMRAVTVLKRLYIDQTNMSNQFIEVGNMRPNQQAQDDLHQLTHDSIARSPDRGVSGRISLGHMDTAGLQFPDNLNQVDMSALQMFDSIIWDPIEPGESNPDPDVLSSAWIY